MTELFFTQYFKEEVHLAHYFYQKVKPSLTLLSFSTYSQLQGVELENCLYLDQTIHTLCRNVGKF